MPRRTRVTAWVVVLCAAACLPLAGGCGGYAVPGRGADFQKMGVKPADQFTDGSITDALAKRPQATFPAGVAVIRVQAPGYRSQTAEGWGNGAYSIVTTRDIERPDQVERLARLPGVAGIAPLNRLLLPHDLKTDLELRQAAAALHADLLLIYTLDTTFQVDDKAAPLSVVTLGLSPNQVAHVVSTASAVLMDTRNGYLYGVAEHTDRQSQLASAWTSGAAVDEARRRAEAGAFENLVGELEKMWAGVYATHGAVKVGAAQATPRPY
jgi:hypothetical protein